MQIAGLDGITQRRQNVGIDVGLDGNAAGMVTPEDEAVAEARLAELAKGATLSSLERAGGRGKASVTPEGFQFCAEK